MSSSLPDPISEVSSRAWQALASRSVFFGHQSVGRDLLRGVERVLRDRPELPIRTVATENPNLEDGPALISARIGRNREPQTKTDAFTAVLRGGFGERPGAIAFYKYCYVDVAPATDPDQLFAAYAESIDAIEREFPALTIGHVTIPLHLAATGLRGRLAEALGRPSQTPLNRGRERFNDLLRQRYEGRVFDLARLESTARDGGTAGSRRGKETIRMLAPEWTTDGGHLNDEAQYWMAERLLVFLAHLATTAHPAAGTQDDRADHSAR